MYIALAAGVLLSLWIILTFNALVGGRNKARKAWSDVDVQLKRRHDLVPALEALVKEYAKNEQEVFVRVTEARTRAMASGTPAEHSGSEPALTQSVGGLLLLAEAYPALKASESYQKLMDELTAIESAIESSRRYYNGSVLAFNTAIGQFPTLLIAHLFRFRPFELFDLDTRAA